MGALPLDDYIPFKEGSISPTLKASTRDNIEFMARDDDMDYPLLGLLALESKGAELTSRNMANTWLGRMPYYFLYTAESVAYRNFVNRRWPPESATWRNPYREWIGAQIRADVFGWVTPGWPEKAAELAYRDASISHVKNGIYGEMFVAAMLAASFVTSDVEEIVRIGLSEIPAKCRLAETVHDTLAWCREESNWEAVWDRINGKYGHYHGAHTINNAALVVMGLAFGAVDYENGIVVTVRAVGTPTATAPQWARSSARSSARTPCPRNGQACSATASCPASATATITGSRSWPNAPIASPWTCWLRRKRTTRSPWRLGTPAGYREPGTLDFQWGKPVLTVNEDLSGQVEYTAYDEVSKIRDVRVDGKRVRFVFACTRERRKSMSSSSARSLETVCPASGL